ncbi:MAG: class I SAM-dependent methyltransferase [Acidimicrobiales bacterium]
MRGFDAATYGERIAAVYDDWYGEGPDADATVDAIVSLARGGPVLELGVGTGRLALPLVARGVEVHGVDASPAMVARLSAKPGGDAVRAVIGDFAEVPAAVPDGFAVVVVAYNTLFNLTSAQAQRRCFATVARRLRPGGAFVVEAFVPDEGPLAPTSGVAPSRIETDEVVLTAFRRDPDQQSVVGSLVSITESGIRLHPWQIRYAGTAELDAMAHAAGMVVGERWGGWRREPFTEDSPRHVTVYRAGGGAWAR